MSQQADPQEDVHRAVEALMASSRLVTAVIAGTLADVGSSVNVPQFRALVMLREREQMNLTSIAEGLGVNASNASRTCDRLADAGLIRRAPDRTDGRAISVRLTAKGRRMIDSVMEARRIVFDQLVTGMSGADQRRLARGLEALLTAVEHTEHAGSTNARSAALLHWVR